MPRHLRYRSRSHALVAVADEPGGRRAVLDTEDLVGRAQVLFHRGLGQEDALIYLGIGHTLADEIQGLALAIGEDSQVHNIFVGDQVFEELPRRYDLTFDRYPDGADYLIGRHAGVNEPTRSCVECGPSRGQLEVQPKDEAQSGRIQLPYPGEPLLGQALRQAGRGGTLPHPEEASWLQAQEDRRVRQEEAFGSGPRRTPRIHPLRAARVLEAGGRFIGKRIHRFQDSQAPGVEQKKDRWERASETSS